MVANVIGVIVNVNAVACVCTNVSANVASNNSDSYFPSLFHPFRTCHRLSARPTAEKRFPLAQIQIWQHFYRIRYANLKILSSQTN